MKLSRRASWWAPRRGWNWPVAAAVVLVSMCVVAACGFQRPAAPGDRGDAGREPRASAPANTPEPVIRQSASRPGAEPAGPTVASPQQDVEPPSQRAPAYAAGTIFYDATGDDFSKPVAQPIRGSLRMGLLKPGTWGLYEREVPTAAYGEGRRYDPEVWRQAGRERIKGSVQVVDLLHRYRADAARTEQVVRWHRGKASDQALALDCEFDVFRRGVSDAERRERLASIVDAMQGVARAAPGALVTAYDEAGHQHLAGQNDPAKVERVRQMHRVLREAGLNSARISGYVPSVSLYTLDDDEEAWRRARVKVEAAREHPEGRVIAWVWARYHDGAFMPDRLRGRPLPLDVWERQLRFLADLPGVDIAIWNGRPSDASRGERWVDVAERVVADADR